MAKKFIWGVLVGWALAIVISPQMVFGLFRRQSA